MKKHLSKIAILMLAVTMASCSNDDKNNALTVTPTVATQAEFKALQEQSLENITQHFQFNTGTGTATFTSVKGVTIKIPSNNLYLNGSLASGIVDLEYIEIFDKATMATTNKATVGRKSNGDLAMLLSGGEFYINATIGGQQLEISGSINLIIPTALTGELNNNMRLWNGMALDSIAGNDNLVWDEAGIDGTGQDNFVVGAGTDYYTYLTAFGWTNVDCFYSSPDPKTTILAKVPDGYDFQNSTVYLSYDGLGNALARLDKFTADSLFSEHYGQIPIGLQCHAIFMSSSNGLFKYAIKAVTITQGGIITFSASDLQTGTESELVAAIQAIQS